MSERKTEIIRLRVTPTFKSRLHQAADAAGESMSVYLEESANQRMAASNAPYKGVATHVGGGEFVYDPPLATATHTTITPEVWAKREAQLGKARELADLHSAIRDDFRLLEPAGIFDGFQTLSASDPNSSVAPEDTKTADGTVQKDVCPHGLKTWQFCGACRRAA